MASGKSKGGNGGPYGERRKTKEGELAPRSIRAKGKRLLQNCTQEELEKSGIA